MKLWPAILIACIVMTPIGGAFLCLIIWLLKGAPKRKYNANNPKAN